MLCCQGSYLAYMADGLANTLGRGGATLLLSSRKVSGRIRSSYLNILDLSLRYMYSGNCRKEPEQFPGGGPRKGAPYVKKMLKAPKPDTGSKT
jgi:hypothetical protein